MVQQLRPEEPLYTCVVPIDSLTGNQDEEIMAFGESADSVKSKAEQLLAENYGCNDDAVRKLIQQARIEPVSHWCSPSRNQG